MCHCMSVCAGNVKTQYQFRSCDADATDEQVAEFLSIDCERLSQMVRCVPLHQRLHIDDSLFDVSSHS